MVTSGRDCGSGTRSYLKKKDKIIRYLERSASNENARRVSGNTVQRGLCPSGGVTGR